MESRTCPPRSSSRSSPTYPPPPFHISSVVADQIVCTEDGTFMNVKELGFKGFKSFKGFRFRTPSTPNHLLFTVLAVKEKEP